MLRKRRAYKMSCCTDCCTYFQAIKRLRILAKCCKHHMHKLHCCSEWYNKASWLQCLTFLQHTSAARSLSWPLLSQTSTSEREERDRSWLVSFLKLKQIKTQRLTTWDETVCSGKCITFFKLIRYSLQIYLECHTRKAKRIKSSNIMTVSQWID